MDNKLSLHLGKTESILFGSKHRLKKCSSLNVSCKGVAVAPTSSVTYLGAELDQTLSGESMADKIAKKSNSRLKFMYRKGNCLTNHCKKLLISALIQPHFDYASSFWYSSLTSVTRKRLQICQNKLIRFILNLGSRSRISADHFVQLNWLPTEFRVQQNKLNLMYKIVNDQAPAYLTENIVYTKDVHSIYTRHSVNSIAIPSNLGSYGLKTFLYTGIKCWNSLPSKIQKEKVKLTFKSLVKQYLLTKVVTNEKDVFLQY